jgi:hypothetical protein
MSVSYMNRRSSGNDRGADRDGKHFTLSLEMSSLLLPALTAWPNGVAVIRAGSQLMVMQLMVMQLMVMQHQLFMTMAISRGLLNCYCCFFISLLGYRRQERKRLSLKGPALTLIGGQ